MNRMLVRIALVSMGVLAVGIMGPATRADTVVQFNLNYSGTGTTPLPSYFDVDLNDSQAPITVDNFLRYVDNGLYNNTIIHRDAQGFVTQGGGFTPVISGGTVTALQPITTFAPIPNEFSSSRSNVLGTIAMAKVGNDPNSATSQWFVNLANNAPNLDNQNGGFTVFGSVTGNGMALINSIDSLPQSDLSQTFGSAFTNVPLFNNGTSFVTITSAAIISSGSTSSLSGVAYVDWNHNGTMDGSDYAIAGAQVSLMQTGHSTPVATVTSGSDGSYHFNNLPSGTYSVQIAALSSQSNQDNGSSQLVIGPNGSIVSAGTSGPAVQSGGTVTLGEGQAASNFNIAESAYPSALMSVRMLLNSSIGIPHTSGGTAVPGTNASNSLLSFGSVLVGGAAGSTTLTVTNLGGQGSVLSGTLPAASGVFGSTGTTPFGPLDAGQAASQPYTYTPTGRGASTQGVTVATNVGNLGVTFSGTGVAPVSSLTQSDAGYALVGGTGAVGTVTVQNTGDGNLSGAGTISNLNGTISGGTGSFSGAGGTVSLGDSASQVFSYTFAPTMRGTASATISGSFSNGNPDGTNTANTATVTVAGTGVAPVSSLTQSDAGIALVGGTGAVGSVTVQNTGNGNLAGTGTLSNLNGTISGGTGSFSGAGGTVSLGDSASQVFSYTFAPTVRGTASATISASFSNGNPDGTNTANTATVAVAGTGAAPVSSLTQTPGYALVGGTGAAASVTVQNTGDGNQSGAGTISNLNGTVTSGTGSFSGAGGTVSLGDSASQAFNYTFTPTVRGTASATISASFSNGNPDGTNTANTANVTISGVGVAPVSSLTQTPGYALVGGTGAAASVTVQNTGDGNLSGLGDSSNLIGTVAGGTGSFSGAGGTVSLNDGTSQAFSYTFTPTVRGTASATISASFSNGNPDGTNTANTANVAISGVGVAPVQSVDTSAADAGLVRIGTAGTASVTIKNIGDGNFVGPGAASNLNGAVASASGDFNGAGGTVSLADNTPQTFSFAYTPTTHGAGSTTIAATFSNGSADGKNLAETVNAALHGQGVGPVYSSDTAPGLPLAFGTISQGNVQSFLLGVSNASTDANGGNTALTDLTLLSATITGTDSGLFSVVGFTPGSVLHEGDLSELEIDYNGTGAVGDISALLTILTDEGAGLGLDGNSFAYPISASLTAAAGAVRISASVVPEPGSLVLLAVAGLCLAGLIRRRWTIRRD